MLWKVLECSISRAPKPCLRFSTSFFVVLKKRAIADEMVFQFDAVALARIAPAAKNGGISLGFRIA
jgi:hypothetical protein